MLIPKLSPRNPNPVLPISIRPVPSQQNIVAHSLQIHSEKCIGCILKYYWENFDMPPLSIMPYEGRSAAKNSKMQYYTASQICLALEYFAANCGGRYHHLTPGVELLRIHLEHQKVVPTYSESDTQQS
jgi:hypothetical protein